MSTPTSLGPSAAPAREAVQVLQEDAGAAGPPVLRVTAVRPDPAHHRLDLLRLVDFALDSKEEGVEKPQPEIFQRALARAGVAAADAAYVGDLYEIDGDRTRADRLRGEAKELQTRFERDFWMEAEQCYAQALDGDKKQVPAVTSNAGHALWCGIASPEHGAAVTRRLMELDMYTGWGIRTLSSKYPTYNPMSYHNGSVWPHDTSLIVQGFARYGHREEAAEVAGAYLAGRRRSTK